MDSQTYRLMSDMIERLINSDSRADLAQLAAISGYEPTYFQKLFTEYVGVSPAQFQRFLRARQARELLLQGYPTLEATYEAGLSGQGRLHDLCVHIEAATPGEIKARGQGMTVTYGWHDSAFGRFLIAQTEKGICFLAFAKDGDMQHSKSGLQHKWPRAAFIQDENATYAAAQKVWGLWEGKPIDSKIRLNLYGTNFQLQVWQALLKIPAGAVTDYQTVATYLEKPDANRAVGSAVGQNPVALIIPCHRVIQKSGLIENYAWGTPRKKALLGLEGIKASAYPASHTGPVAGRSATSRP